MSVRWDKNSLLAKNVNTGYGTEPNIWARKQQEVTSISSDSYQWSGQIISVGGIFLINKVSPFRSSVSCLHDSGLVIFRDVFTRLVTSLGRVEHFWKLGFHGHGVFQRFIEPIAWNRNKRQHSEYGTWIGCEIIEDNKSKKKYLAGCQGHVLEVLLAQEHRH